MSELISGKEAWINAVNGESVQYNLGMQWEDLTGRELNYWQGERFLNKDLNYKFRLKPRTIMIGNIEVPVPFDPKDGDDVFVLDNANPDGFSSFVFDSYFFTINFGAWRTEEEIRQVVAALRSIFNESS